MYTVQTQSCWKTLVKGSLHITGPLISTANAGTQPRQRPRDALYCSLATNNVGNLFLLLFLLVAVFVFNRQLYLSMSKMCLVSLCLDSQTDLICPSRTTEQTFPSPRVSPSALNVILVFFLKKIAL